MVLQILCIVICINDISYLKLKFLKEGLKASALVQLTEKRQKCNKYQKFSSYSL